jgi:hypothetical protein
LVTAYLGLSTDEPQPADWDGDGDLDPGVWRSADGAWLAEGGSVVATGALGDEPLMLSAGVRTFRHPPSAHLPTTGRDGAAGTLALADLGFSSRLGAALMVAMVIGAALRHRRRCSRAISSGFVSLKRWISEQALGGLPLLAGAFALPLGAARLGPVTAADALLLSCVALRLAAGRTSAVWRAWESVPRVVILGGVLALSGGLIGGLLGTDGAVGWRALARAAAGVCLPLIALVLDQQRRGRRRDLAMAFAGGVAFSVAVGLSQVAVGERMSGLATHPNHLGLTALLGVAMASAALATQATMTARVLLLLNLLGVVFSGSRAALIGLAALVVWSLATGPSGRRWKRPVPVVRTAPVGVVTLAALVHGAAIHRLAGDPASDAGRRFRLELAVARIKRAPLTGEGFRFLEEAHSLPLQLLASGGPLTLLGGGLLLAAPLVLGARDRADVFTSALCAGWVAYLLVALFQNIVVDRYVWFLAALILIRSTVEEPATVLGVRTRPGSSRHARGIARRPVPT